MNTIAKSFFLAALFVTAAATHAATVEVDELRLNEFDFVMTIQSGAGHSGESSSAETLDTNANLLAGPADPLLSFNLDDVSFGSAGSESWNVEARTLGPSSATIDTDSNEITINLSGWSTSWTQLGVVPPRSFRGCGGAFPECDDIDQSPETGSVTGPWDPATGNFEVSWSRDIAVHPFPLGVGNWTLRGNVVPLPGALWLMISGIGALGAFRLRRTGSKVQ